MAPEQSPRSSIVHGDGGNSAISRFATPATRFRESREKTGPGYCVIRFCNRLDPLSDVPSLSRFPSSCTFETSGCRSSNKSAFNPRWKKTVFGSVVLDLPERFCFFFFHRVRVFFFHERGDSNDSLYFKMADLCSDVGHRFQTKIDLHFRVLELISTCFNTGTTNDKIKCNEQGRFYNIVKNASFYLHILLKIVRVFKYTRYTSLQIYTRYEYIKFL